MADSDERTELPSEHKKQKAREEGNVSKSQEVSGFLALLVGFGVIFALLPSVAGRIQSLFVYAMQFGVDDFSPAKALNLAFFIITQSVFIVLPIFAVLLVIGVLSNVAQIGFLVTIKTIIPNLAKLNMIKGFKNVISLRKLLDGALITLKVTVALCVGFFVFLGFLEELGNVAFLSLFQQLLWLKDKALTLAGALLVLFFFMAMLDFYIRRRQYIENLKMTKQEVRDEFKNIEGNPEIKARVRQLMRRAASRKMLSKVATATVVVTNPTHYAVAIFHDVENMNKGAIPVVVAKGIDFMAIRIKELARENNVPIRENPPLARDLYAACELDQEIPNEMLMKAVLTVLLSIDDYAQKAMQKQLET